MENRPPYADQHHQGDEWDKVIRSLEQERDRLLSPETSLPQFPLGKGGSSSPPPWQGGVRGSNSTAGIFPRGCTEWDTVLQDLERFESELNHDQTKQVLKHLFDCLDLTPRERQGLDPTLEQLRGMLDRIEQSVVQIAVFGLVGRGKSSVLNALIGENVFPTGPLHGITTTVATSHWAISQDPLVQPIDSVSQSSSQSSPKLLRVSLPALSPSQTKSQVEPHLEIASRIDSRIDSRIELVDTPGIDEVDGEQRTALAHQVAKQADLILFVVAGDMTSVEHAALSELRQFSKPILLVFNKVDQYPDADRQHIYQTLQNQRVKDVLSPDEIVMVAAAPLVSEVVQQPDGYTTIKRRRGPADVLALKLKILDVLQREGKALTALNTMLYADEVNDQLVQRKTDIRDRAANDLIWNIVMAKAIATALNPITVIDILSGAVVDVVLLVALSRLYGMPMTHHGAIKLLRSIALGMGGISITELLTTLGLSSLKGALGLAIPGTGGLSLAPYVSVAIAQAGVAGVATYGIGQISKQYLANGASWGDNSPKTAIKAILSSLDEASILHRVKSELEERLSLNPSSSG